MTRKPFRTNLNKELERPLFLMYNINKRLEEAPYLRETTEKIPKYCPHDTPKAFREDIVDYA